MEILIEEGWNQQQLVAAVSSCRHDEYACVKKARRPSKFTTMQQKETL